MSGTSVYQASAASHSYREHARGRQHFTNFAEAAYIELVNEAQST